MSESDVRVRCPTPCVTVVVTSLWGENASRGREEALVKKRYTESFKARMVQRLVLPGGPAVKVLSKEVGVAPSSLWEWRKRFGTVGSMASDEEAKDLHARRPEDWSVKERLRAVAEAESLSDEELGVFLRREGLHEETLRQWREAVGAALMSEDARLRTAAADRKRIQVLEKELGRKERALAAANAVVALQKKVHALWGDEDDDTSSGTDK
jgi:transposase